MPRLETAFAYQALFDLPLKEFIPHSGQPRLQGTGQGTIAVRSPELAARLPPQRKCYMSEDVRMSIFDAAAVAVIANSSRQLEEFRSRELAAPSPPVPSYESLRT